MSTARRKEGAAIKAVQINARKEAKQAAKGKPQSRMPASKEPSARPYHEPQPAAKEKRIVRTVSERDGQNLLRKIEAKGGRDIIVMMRDSRQTPQELAEGLMLDETIVISSLDAYGSGKDRVKRLLAAIEQAPRYLKDDGERPVTTGVRKQKRQGEAQAKQEGIASRKRNPRTRTFVTPTVAELTPKREDQHIVYEELKQYLKLNANLRDRVMNAPSDQKAARVLMFNVGQRFDMKVKALLAAPPEYQDLLAKAGATIRREAHKYDTSDAPLTGPTPSIQESPEAISRHQSQEAAWDNYKTTSDSVAKQSQPDAGDPEEEAKREIFSRQENTLKTYLEAHDPAS